MLRKILSLALVGLLLNLGSIGSAYAAPKEEQQVRFVERVKKSIAKLGTGTDARVEVRLQDKTKLKGYLQAVGEDSFVVIDAKSGAATTVAYPQVEQVTAQKKGLSADEAKAEIAKLGTGPKSVVRVTLKDDRKVQGWLSFAGEDHFTLTTEKSGALTDIKYSDVARVKSLKPSKGAVIAVTVGGLALSLLIFLFV